MNTSSQVVAASETPFTTNAAIIARAIGGTAERLGDLLEPNTQVVGGVIGR